MDMKTNTLLKIFALTALSLVTVSGFAQSPVGNSGTTATQDISLRVDGSALLAIVNTSTGATGTGISMSLSGATQAGAEIKNSSTNDSTRLRISSLVESGKTRKILAQINQSLSGSGTNLYVQLKKPGNFGPHTDNGGTPTGTKVQFTTANANVELVTGITTCWSGVGLNDGYTVEYTYEKQTNATSLQSKNVMITYTITQEQ